MLMWILIEGSEIVWVCRSEMRWEFASEAGEL